MDIDDATVIRHINRRLRHQGQQLHVARQETTDTGRHCITENGVLVAGHQDAVELGVDTAIACRP